MIMTIFHSTSALVATVFSQLTVSLSGSWSLGKPPLNFIITVSLSVMCLTICWWPPLQSSDVDVQVSTWINSDHEWHSRSKPLCCIVGHTLSDYSPQKSTSNPTVHVGHHSKGVVMAVGHRRASVCGGWYNSSQFRNDLQHWNNEQGGQKVGEKNSLSFLGFSRAINLLSRGYRNKK